MTQLSLSTRQLLSLKATGKPYFVRDTKLRGLGVKVTSKGQKKYVVEVWHDNASTRKTIGEFPYMTLQEARRDALKLISERKAGLHQKESKEIPLKTLLKEYLGTGRLKERTAVDYKDTVNFYLYDWVNKPVNTITKKMVEKRFCRIRDKGIKGGKPTKSQAAKTMRVLSALMNYARGDDLIEMNPVEVLKLKKIDRSLKPKTSYLRPPEVRKLLEVTEGDNHPGTLSVLLMLYTGLRRREALSIRWDDIRDIEEDLSVIVIGDTKNSQPHYVPFASRITEVLHRATNSSQYVFPSPQSQDFHMGYLNKTVRRLSKAIGKHFTPHDLRRTFATRASEVGIDYLMIKRLLNHKTNDITARYIQWDSRKNLEAMRDALDMVKW